MPPLQSSAIAFVDYDEDTDTLTVTFHNGRSYTHTGVPPEVYQQLMASASPGSFYSARIKGVY